MRISIWQQFSSNHSSMFTVVGVFETPSAALDASAKIRDLFEQIAAWHAENPELARIIASRRLQQPDLISMPEQEIARRYQIDWLTPFDAFNDYEMTAFAQFLFIHNTRASMYSATPLQSLMTRLGAIANIQEVGISHCWIFNSIQFDLICEAPTPEIAAEIAAEFGSATVAGNYCTIKFDIENRPDTGTRPAMLIKAIRRVSAYEGTTVKIDILSQQWLRRLQIEDETR